MPQDIELEENVRSALARDPRVDHDQAIAVFASAGSVTLRGSVESFKQRHAAVEDAHAVTGVVEVYDQLDLRPFPHDPHDDEMRGAALQALIRDPRVHETTIDVAGGRSLGHPQGRGETSARERRRIRGRGNARRRRRHHQRDQGRDGPSHGIAAGE